MAIEKNEGSSRKLIWGTEGKENWEDWVLVNEAAADENDK